MRCIDAPACCAICRPGDRACTSIARAGSGAAPTSATAAGILGHVVHRAVRGLHGLRHR
jgi:hypothetical protein